MFALALKPPNSGPYPRIGPLIIAKIFFHDNLKMDSTDVSLRYESEQNWLGRKGLGAKDHGKSPGKSNRKKPSPYHQIQGWPVEFQRDDLGCPLFIGENLVNKYSLKLIPLLFRGS